MKLVPAPCKIQNPMFERLKSRAKKEEKTVFYYIRHALLKIYHEGFKKRVGK